MRLPIGLFLLVAMIAIGPVAGAADDAAPAPSGKADAPSAKQKPKDKINALPGIEIDAKKGYIDVAGKICIDEGMLELIACTKDSKEHESIVALEAKAQHLHLALVILGAKAGNPPAWKYLKDQDRWIGIPPRGDLVKLSLVHRDIKGAEVETPINKFVQTQEGDALPTDQFVFSGSRVHKAENGAKRYMADVDGNVVSVVSFGDETLCLPQPASHANDQLVWQVNPKTSLRPGTSVKLRLRPIIIKKDKPRDNAKPAPKKKNDKATDSR